MSVPTVIAGPTSDTLDIYTAPAQTTRLAASGKYVIPVLDLSALASGAATFTVIMQLVAAVGAGNGGAPPYSEETFVRTKGPNSDTTQRWTFPPVLMGTGPSGGGLRFLVSSDNAGDTAVAAAASVIDALSVDASAGSAVAASLSGTQTFDMAGNITGNLSGSVGTAAAIGSGAIVAASFAVGAITNAAFADADILDAVPADDAKPLVQIQWVFQQSFFKRQTTPTSEIICNDLNAPIGASAISVSGTTIIRGKFS